MDGPLGPDYQGRDVLLDLKPFIDAEGYDLGQLDDNAVKDFTTTDGVVFGLPRDLNVIALYYNKDMFDAAGIPYPDDTWDLGQADRGRQAADHGHGRRRHDRPVGPLHRDDRHGERLVLVRVAGGRRHPVRGRHDHPRSTDRRVRRPGSSSSRTSSGRRRSCPTRRSSPRPVTPSSRAWPRWRSTARGWCRRTRPRASTSGIAPLPAGPAGKATSVNPTGAVVYTEHRCPGGVLGARQVPRQPARRRSRSWRSRLRCRRTRRS